MGRSHKNTWEGHGKTPINVLESKAGNLNNDQKKFS